ncbi:MAG: DUF2271 domain-containing protein [Pirellulales bacterium]
MFHHLNVLGTQLELRLNAESSDNATAAEQAALTEIERLNRILSSYDTNSELNRWVAASNSTQVSPELADVLRASEKWHRLSGGAFHPGIETATRLWKQAEKKQQYPSNDELAAVAKGLQEELGWKWDNEASHVRSNGNALSFNAIAKGMIIDRVCEHLATQAGISGGLVAVGGDMRAFGDCTRTVRLLVPEDNLAAPTTAVIELHDRALATSSGAFRGVTINGKKYSHLIDPRTARPVDQVLSVTVTADRAGDADALATLCSVLSPSQSLALVDSTPTAACMITDARGSMHTSARWPKAAAASLKLVSLTARAEDWNGGMEMKVDFAINQADSGGRYRRPYVAVWVEDKDGYPVKTLVLWVQSTGPGPRWIPDLRRWYKSDQLRKLVDELNLVQTVSEATRKPGTYSVVWDGTDDNKKLVKPGEYTLYVEAAREHGTYQLAKKKLAIGTDAFKEKLDDNVEVKSVAIDYRKRAAK